MTRKNPNQVSMYLNAADKAAAEALLDKLIKQGVDLTDHKGNPSLSALFRWLVMQETNRQ